MAEDQKEHMPYLGSVKPATAKGWMELVAESNKMATKGYHVVGVSPLRGGVGVLYRKTASPVLAYTSFSEADEYSEVVLPNGMRVPVG